MEANQPDILDTIPDSLKQGLYTNRSPPDLCKDYDVLGFDADHCLVKYNLPYMTDLICRLTADDLCDKMGYPEQIKQWPARLMAMSLNNIVWDIEHRALLKLGEDKLVVQAYRGSQRMSNNDIEAVYGSPPVFATLNYPAQRN